MSIKKLKGGKALEDRIAPAFMPGVEGLEEMGPAAETPDSSTQPVEDSDDKDKEQIPSPSTTDNMGEPPPEGDQPIGEEFASDGEPPMGSEPPSDGEPMGSDLPADDQPPMGSDLPADNQPPMGSDLPADNQPPMG
ncbi:hypothetical protein MHK_002511, partial [Candidatus Magnetomorum sp. HK-1]